MFHAPKIILTPAPSSVSLPTIYAFPKRSAPPPIDVTTANAKMPPTETHKVVDTASLGDVKYNPAFIPFPSINPYKAGGVDMILDMHIGYLQIPPSFLHDDDIAFLCFIG